MAGSFSDYLEDKVIDHLLRNQAFTPPATIYVALFTVAPTDAGGGTEVSGGSYARTSFTLAASSGGASSNSATITFPTATGSWGTVVAFGVFDASTSGNLLFWADLAANKSVSSGETAEFASGELDVSVT